MPRATDRPGDGIIHSVRVAIRPYRPSDVDAILTAALESVAEVGPWFAWCHTGLTHEDCLAFVESRSAVWARGEAYSFAIVEREQGGYLGGVWLTHVDLERRSATLGYWVRSSATGAGIATVAATLAARFAFERLGLERLGLRMGAVNRRSRRVAERLGARLIERRAGGLTVGAVAHDALLYELVPDDLLAEGAGSSGPSTTEAD